MIVEWLLGLGASLVEGLLGALPTFDPPGWIASGTGSIITVLQTAGSLGHWVPLGLFAVVVAAVIACLLVGVGIKVTRIVASHLTLGGGSAG